MSRPSSTSRTGTLDRAVASITSRSAASSYRKQVIGIGERLVGTIERQANLATHRHRPVPRNNVRRDLPGPGDRAVGVRCQGRKLGNGRATGAVAYRQRADCSRYGGRGHYSSRAARFRCGGGRHLHLDRLDLRPIRHRQWGIRCLGRRHPVRSGSWADLRTGDRRPGDRWGNMGWWNGGICRRNCRYGGSRRGKASGRRGDLDASPSRRRRGRQEARSSTLIGAGGRATDRRAVGQTAGYRRRGASSQEADPQDGRHNPQPTLQRHAASLAPRELRRKGEYTTHGCGGCPRTPGRTGPTTVPGRIASPHAKTAHAILTSVTAMYSFECGTLKESRNRADQGSPGGTQRGR